MQPGYARLRGSEADAGGDVEAEEEDNRPESDAAVEDNYGSLWDDVDGSNVPEELRSPRDHDAHSIIDVLSSQLQNREIPQYLDEFEVVIPDAEVVVGSVPIEEIQQREQQVEEARLRQAELESNLYRQREIHLAQQEALARERLLQEARRRHAELVLKDRQAAEAMQLRARRIGHVFQQAETHLTDTLKKQEARVEQLYGALMPSRVPQSRKRYRVEWARIPLTIRIRGRMLNAVKDKLPPASGCTCVTGDWFKLYVRFQAQEGSGLVGIFIVVILYVALTCLSLLGLYIYLLYIHMNGRMLDVYRRIHGHEDTFFVPHDAEISLQELQTVCTQATRWKGPRGTQRKVFVHEYALSDPLDPLFRETNTHIAVYNVELDGSRELHRHFLKMPDGAVLELFGELGENTDGNWKSDAPQGAASLALLYNILQDVQQDGNSSSMTSAAIFEGL
ncbi:uncharacterized protein IUM83_06616 [Phytophthora cinnamomi]|uniref:uncharacterized protein n=1 Tax=Phytophthora cinnamomi TaxID=4785 RepID=UPI00355A755F|nr:hypothetical protein IUM83_06616 [Phytophthora cinnamomi]